MIIRQLDGVVPNALEVDHFEGGAAVQRNFGGERQCPLWRNRC